MNPVDIYGEAERWFPDDQPVMGARWQPREVSMEYRQLQAQCRAAFARGAEWYQGKADAEIARLEGKYSRLKDAVFESNARVKTQYGVEYRGTYGGKFDRVMWHDSREEAASDLARLTVPGGVFADRADGFGVNARLVRRTISGLIREEL